jgi:CHAT domain-containing protein
MAARVLKTTSIAGLLAILIGGGLMASRDAGAVDSIDPLRAEREAYIEHFRIHGRQELERVRTLEARLQAVVRESEGPLKVKASALYELATVQRLTNRFGEAIGTYQQAAATAARLGLDDVAFDAWIGIARAYGTRDHGRAKEAFRRAVDIAGSDPTPKQSYEMADYASQLQAGRGELEAALVNAIEANRLARNDEERFYAQLNVGDVLQKFAESCDYRKLIDAKTSAEGDSWGACRRAVRAAESYYAEARDTAKRLGWNFLSEQADGFISALGVRLSLINQRASLERVSTAKAFTAQDVNNVLANEDFAAGASGLSEHSALGEMISQVVTDAQTDDPRSLYLLGIRADFDGDSKAALDYFERAVALLEQERFAMFDLRRRGTVVENRPELVRDLALRLLALGQYEDAFLAFESIRARGLGELATAYEANRFTDAERRWLGKLAQAESQESAILSDIVRTTIAGVEHSKSATMLKQLQQIRARHRELLRMKDYKETNERLASAAHVPATLDQLQGVVRESNVSVLLYWVTHTNVLIWVISPQGMDVKTVFLPEVAVIEKVNRVVKSIRTVGRPYDQTAARELHTYLIQPFADYLNGEQVLIVPQGPLVTLPFEALIDTRTGDFLIESMAVSYAPSATFAARVLRSKPSEVKAITAIFDDSLEQITGEISRIGENRLVEVSAMPSRELSAQSALELLGRSGNVHVLLHGMFDHSDPLQSRITLNNPALSREENEITAADLLAVDWRGTHLAVFSSCEGAMMNIRISNEVYGLSWAPLVGGVDHVLMSRWRVKGDSNADWMANFYESLAPRKDSPALAAAAAMREMITGERTDPFYWAGPQVFGR